MGKTYLIDTNIVTKLFERELSPAGMDLLSSLLIQQTFISVINRIELLSWNPESERLVSTIRDFLAVTPEQPLTEPIIQRTIELRRMFRLKLPDAIIAATALEYDSILLSDNDRDFGKIRGLRYVNPVKL